LNFWNFSNILGWLDLLSKWVINPQKNAKQIYDIKQIIIIIIEIKFKIVILTLKTHITGH
jgi:type III secretory pathway component EscU